MCDVTTGWENWPIDIPTGGKNGLPITPSAHAPMLVPDLMLSLPLSLSLSLHIPHCLPTLPLSPLSCPPSPRLSLSPPALSLSPSFIRLAVPGAMANHLIPNSLLRPHGTNNPYNTLLGESSIYNNPLGMYNTQGVASLSLSPSFSCL